MLNIYFQIPISVLTPLNLKKTKQNKKKTVSTKKVTTKEKPVNFNTAESSEVKSLVFPVS